jgi:hypothetical protein
MLFYHCPFTSLSRSFLFCKLFVHIYQTEPIIWFFIFFNFSQNYRLLNLVHFCEILHIHIFFVLLKSSYSFQARCFLFYKIFVHIPKVCMGTGFLLSLPNNVWRLIVFAPFLIIIIFIFIFIIIILLFLSFRGP